MSLIKIDKESAKLLETKPLIVIIYALVASIVFLVGMYLRSEAQHRDEMRAKDAIIAAQARELVNAYKETRDTYKELNNLFQPKQYYEKGNSNSTDSATDSYNR